MSTKKEKLVGLVQHKEKFYNNLSKMYGAYLNKSILKVTDKITELRDLIRDLGIAVTETSMEDTYCEIPCSRPKLDFRVGDNYFSIKFLDIMIPRIPENKISPKLIWVYVIIRSEKYKQNYLLFRYVYKIEDNELTELVESEFETEFKFGKSDNGGIKRHECTEDNIYNYLYWLFLKG